MVSEVDQKTVNNFDLLFYRLKKQYAVRWDGLQILKYPSDLITYANQIHVLMPTLIVETGSCNGASALFFAHMLDLLGQHHPGKVISIDIERRKHLPAHDRIRYVNGNSVSDAVFKTVSEGPESKNCVMVVLDSDHSSEHVQAELRLYSSMVTPGSLIVVEDTNVGGHPVWPDFGNGPWDAVQKFLAESKDFVADPSCETYLHTSNPGGWLRRVA